MNGYDEPYKLGFASEALKNKKKQTHIYNLLHIVRPKKNNLKQNQVNEDNSQPISI